MKVKKLSLLAIFISLSVVGAMIKVPAPISSVALDLLPALVGVVVLGRNAGSLVACLGHLLSALFGGMPLGPFHMLIAFEMALLVYGFGYIYQKGKRILAAIFLVIGNTFVASLPFLFIIGIGFYVGMIPSLFIGSVINAALAIILAPSVETYFVKRLHI
ncbi:ECF transporter S component [Bacillus andreraoultii]|uniref:ECF transporter S component n=1 Tax=Bacillus andreraoultii TaxID=1499685 RepID=UPI00053A543E|nr:ECF transporter S component [Bacillus andreraoultii]